MIEEGLFSQAEEEEAAKAIDRRATEQAEINMLLERGFELPCGGKKLRIKAPPLAVMVSAAEDMMKLAFDEAELDSDNVMRSLDEQKRMVVANSWLAARIVAKAYLGSIWLIYLALWPTALFFYSRLTSVDLSRAARLISMSFDLPGFAGSIALLSVSRVTAPPAIEE